MSAPPRPPFLVGVAGAQYAPREIVWPALDQLTGRVRQSHLVVIVTAGGWCTAGDWARADEYNRTTQLEPLLRGLYGRYAEPRWAMTLASICDAIVIFGNARRHWRLLRYARDAGIPTRLIPVAATAIVQPSADASTS